MTVFVRLPSPISEVMVLKTPVAEQFGHQPLLIVVDHVTPGAIGGGGNHVTPGVIANTGPARPAGPNPAEVVAVVTLLAVAILMAVVWSRRRKSNPRPTSHASASVARDTHGAGLTKAYVSPGSTQGKVTSAERSAVDTTAAQHQWRHWAERQFAGPVSQTLAATAAAVRAIEASQDQAHIIAAARSAAAAWAPSASYTPVENISSTEGQWRRWAEKEFPGPASRVLIATAGAMRAIEARQDQAHIIKAARSVAEEWKPAPPASGASLQQSSEMGEAPPGFVRGRLGGLMKNSALRVPLGGRAYTYVVLWSFTIYPTGVGPNGRPLSPIPVRMQGERIVGGGRLEDGDIVEFRGPAWPHQPTYINTLRNLSKHNIIICYQATELSVALRLIAATVVIGAVVLVVMLKVSSGPYISSPYFLKDFFMIAGGIGLALAAMTYLPRLISNTFHRKEVRRFYAAYWRDIREAQAEQQRGKR